MFPGKKFSNTWFVILLILALTVAGCSGNSNHEPSTAANEESQTDTETANNETSNNESADNETASDDGANSEYPIEIKHALGTTVIPEKPERVVTIQWANHDIVLALGVVPVGFSAANFGVQDDSGLLPWTKKKLEELGVTNPNVFRDTDGLDFEAISDAEPDIILAAYSGITQEEYDTLTQIAPVVAYPEKPWVITWREQIRMNAAGMGIPEKGEQLIKDIERFIADTVAKHPQLKGLKAAFTYFSPTDLSSFWVYMTEDPRSGFLEELGMVFPESVERLKTADTGFAMSLSAENADALNDADILITYGNEELLKALQADPVFGKVPAIQRGSMVLIEDNTPLAAAGNPNPLSIQYTLEEYVGLLAEAAAKINK